ncbi:hypothetical protein GN157_00940 [Flavobacterium rakeshii]|uniref:Uncharacterized protein n=1 Tax=Flavobacterium rakeshii TaxID=1038845 RepID=A0A6N8H6J6_9FLAO|nr:hypothetical protein [Flavobacterium rakeshii]MUV02264.1 hypothetical protein [Flavobacterium rakeshii]
MTCNKNIPDESEQLLRLTKKVYLITLVTGLIAFTICMTGNYFTTMITLFIYMLSVAFFNMVMIVNNLINISYYTKNRTKLILRSLMLLLNMPTALLILFINN